MFEVNVNGRKQRYNSKPTMNVDTTGSSASIPKPLTYDYMPEGYPKKDGWSIEWDGNTEGKVTVDVHGDPFCKISDMVLSVDDLLSATITFTDHPGEEVPPLTSDNIQAISDDVIDTSNTSIIIVIVRKDNADWQGITFPEKGVYVDFVNNKFKMSKKNITPMSTDFLPKNLNVVFRATSLTAVPTSCNVTYNELRGWVENDIPVLAVLNANNNHEKSILGYIFIGESYIVFGEKSSASASFKYNSDGTFSEAVES